MFGKTKYVVVDDGMSFQMLIFGDTQKHSDVARSIRGEVISAGFITISAKSREICSGTENARTIAEPVVECWGKSVSLKVESRPEEDTRLAKRVLDIGDPFGD